MSANQMQRALALLIRLPESNRGTELENFLTHFDLTSHERWQLESLSQDKDVVKYGRSMASVRWDQIRKPLVLSRHYIDPDLLETIMREYFEPVAAKVTFNKLALRFLERVMESAEIQRVLQKNSPPFVIDLLKFDLALAHFRLKRFSEVNTPLSTDSLLNHRNFLLLEFDYDVSALRPHILKERIKPSIEPEKRAHRLLFVRKGESFDCRIFEIDDKASDFLEGQLKDPPASMPLPDDYSRFVEMGLCQKIMVH